MRFSGVYCRYAVKRTKRYLYHYESVITWSLLLLLFSLDYVELDGGLW